MAMNECWVWISSGTAHSDLEIKNISIYPDKVWFSCGTWTNYTAVHVQPNSLDDPLIGNVDISVVYTAISKKVALEIHDAWSMFHSLQCIMGVSLVYNMSVKYKFTMRRLRRRRRRCLFPTQVTRFHLRVTKPYIVAPSLVTPFFEIYLAIKTVVISFFHLLCCAEVYKAKWFNQFVKLKLAWSDMDISFLVYFV